MSKRLGGIIGCFKKYLNELLSIPQSGGKVPKRLGRIIGCKDKTSSWHLNGFPDDGRNIGSTVYCRGEPHRNTVRILTVPQPILSQSGIFFRFMLF